MPVWKPLAVSDRKAISKYIAKENPAAAIKLVDAIMQKAEQLDAHPQQGRPGRVPGTLELVVHPNYVLVYQLAGERVEVVRLLHARKSWPPVDDGATDND